MNTITAPPVNMIKFLQVLRQKQAQWAGELSLSGNEGTLEQVWAQWKEKNPALNRELLRVDLERLKNHLSGLFELLQEYREESRSGVETLREFLLSGKQDSILQAIAEWDEETLRDLACAKNLDGDLLVYVARQAIKPYLMEWKRLLEKDLQQLDWLQGYCPVCGSEPGMGRLDKEQYGRRYLFCGHCETQWEYLRLGCPFCENDDQYTLSVYYAEGSKKYRIEACDKCNRYVKTVDEREVHSGAFPLDLIQEDIATVQLDLVAAEKVLNNVTDGKS